MMVILANPLLAVDLPRGTLWRVEQTCVLNQRATGSPFPCLTVDLTGGFAVLRAPFRQTHVVTMPLLRISGVEDPVLQRSGGRDAFEAAWQARHYVQDELKRPLQPVDVGLAVNSRYTRSQDQLHIHVDCVNQTVRDRLAGLVPGLPTDRWQPAAFIWKGQSYAARRLDRTDLTGINVFALAAELPAIAAAPSRTTLAAVGARRPDGGTGFVLMAGQSNPRSAMMQSTSEDLLDHDCRRTP